MLAEWKAEERYGNLYNTFYYDEKLQVDQKNGLKEMYKGTYERKYTKVARIWEEAWDSYDKEQV